MSELRTYTERNLTFRTFLNQTFFVMALGLLISALFAFLATLLLKIIPPQIFIFVVLGSVIVEFAVAMIFSLRLMSMSKTTAWICYILYCALTGISLSMILQIYTLGSASFAFLSTVILFVCMAIIGHTTKADLSKLGTLLFAGLIAVLIISLINIFFIHSQLIEIGVCYLGIFIFLGLIAYDVRKLRDLYNHGLNDNELSEKLMIYGAFQLYLDFINLFIRLLQIFGKRRD